MLTPEQIRRRQVSRKSWADASWGALRSLARTLVLFVAVTLVLEVDVLATFAPTAWPLRFVQIGTGVLALVNLYRTVDCTTIWWRHVGVPR